MPVVLDSVNKSIIVELVESPTNQPDYVVSYIDRTTSSLTEGSGDGTLADATETTVVAAPSASTYRTVRYLSIHNTETSSSITVLVKLANSANKRIIRKAVILAGSTLVYHDHQWSMYNLA